MKLIYDFENIKTHIVDKSDLRTQFLNGLEKYNITADDLIKDGWYYCGGNHKQEDINYFKMNFPNEDFPDFSNECVCGHEIINNCYICPKDESELLVIGSCCIMKFVPIKTRSCKDCKASHKNRKVNLCNECRLLCIDCKITKNYKKDVKCEKCVSKDYERKCANCDIMLDSRKTRYKYCSNCDDRLSNKICGICNKNTYDARYGFEENCSKCEDVKDAKSWCIKCKLYNENFENSDTCDDCNDNVYKVTCEICKVGKYDVRYEYPETCCEKPNYTKICAICNVNTFNSSIWNNCAKCSVEKLIKKQPITKPVEPVTNKCQKCNTILKNPTYKFCFKCFNNCIICQKKVDPRFKKCFDCNKYNKTSRDVEIKPFFYDKIEEPYPY